MLSLTVFSQVKWAPIGAEWYYTYREGASTPSTGYYHLMVSGDTIIESKQCATIFKTLVNSLGEQNFKGKEYIYHDTSANKVFRYVYGDFYLLYDFNKSTGDTLVIKEPYSVSSYDSVTIVVDSVSFETISDSIKLKSLYTTQLFHLSTRGIKFGGKITEKIGNTYYFFPYNDLDCDGGCPQPLRCYSDSDIHLKNYYWSCDTFYTFSNKIRNLQLQLYPNPVLNVLTIKLDNQSITECRVEIFNACGLLIIRKDCYTNKILIDMSDFCKGNYYVRIQTDKDVTNHKILKL